MTDATYPDNLRYHEEHDWARIEGDQATFGITWYAQDSLGEVVFYDPPEVGSTIQKDSSYAEVESVKAVVVLRTGSNLTQDALIEHCRTLIARYKCPRSVAFVDELPRLATGKLDKPTLRARFRSPS